MINDNTPICPNCNKICSVAGTPLLGSGLKYWQCFDCHYPVEDVDFIELKKINLAFDVRCTKCAKTNKVNVDVLENAIADCKSKDIEMEFTIVCYKCEHNFFTYMQFR